MRMLAAWLLLVGSALAQGVVNLPSEIVEVAPGIVELRPESPAAFTGDATMVEWEARQPWDLDLRTYESGGVAVLLAKEGQADVVVQWEATNWDTRSKAKKLWIVRVKPIVPPGPTPPVPPGPTPPTPPAPPSPDPTDVIAARLLPFIVATGDKATAIKLAGNYRSILAKLDSGEIRSVLVARTALANVNSGLRLDVKWRPAIEAMVKELEGITVVADLQRVFKSTANALELAAK